MKKKFRDLMPGDRADYRGRTVVVLEHLDGGTLVQLEESIGDRRFGDSNDWRESPIREYLNEEFAEELTGGNTEELLDMEVDLTAISGATDYGRCVDKVALLTFDQARKYYYVRPRGWDWTCTPFTTNTNYAFIVNTNGNYYYAGCSYVFGVRPAFTLSSSLDAETSEVSGEA